MKYFIAYLFVIVALDSCNNQHASLNAEFEKSLKSNVRQNLEVINSQYWNYAYSINNSYGNRHDLEPYFFASKRLLSIESQFENSIERVKAGDTANLTRAYNLMIVYASGFTDSIKKMEKLKLLEADEENLLFVSRNFSNTAIKDTGLLKMLYLQDFKTQVLNALGIIHPHYGNLKITETKFYDFMIIQSHLNNIKTYMLSVKNNLFFDRGLTDHYNISFRSLKKITGTDTAVMSGIILKKVKALYKTNTITYESGKYLLTLNMNYELPNGTWKVDEMDFEYELE